MQEVRMKRLPTVSFDRASTSSGHWSKELNQSVVTSKDTIKIYPQITQITQIKVIIKNKLLSVFNLCNLRNLRMNSLSHE